MSSVLLATIAVGVHQVKQDQQKADELVVVVLVEIEEAEIEQG